MKTYIVTLPLTGIVSVEVQAEDEASAINKALYEQITHEDIDEWEVMEMICRGNVFYGQQNEASAEEV